MWPIKSCNGRAVIHCNCPFPSVTLLHQVALSKMSGMTSDSGPAPADAEAKLQTQVDNMWRCSLSMSEQLVEGDEGK